MKKWFFYPSEQVVLAPILMFASLTRHLKCSRLCPYQGRRKRSKFDFFEKTLFIELKSYQGFAMHFLILIGSKEVECHINS